MARILDFYGVRWEYEPHTFPILWNFDGAVVESFAPDFYLPDLDLYLEMTTLKQRLVRKKNRKLRRLRELYPDLRIKLFYARDFRMLMLKYGKVGLLGSLSGASGQYVPTREGTSITPADLETGEVPVDLVADALVVAGQAANPAIESAPAAPEPTALVPEPTRPIGVDKSETDGGSRPRRPRRQRRSGNGATAQR